MPRSSSSAISSSGEPFGGLFSATSDDALLCCEEAGSFSEDEDHRVPDGAAPAEATKTSAFASVRPDGGDEDGDEAAAAAWVVTEADHSLQGRGYRSRFRSRSGGHLDAADRFRSVSWILKVTELYQFQPATAYLAVNYMDRFLSRRSLPQHTGGAGGWPVKLLAVACLSLAAKMEEILVPSLLDLQIAEDTTVVFEPRTIQRTELLVLDALGWKLRPATPFTFVHFFAGKADPGGSITARLVSRATSIILATAGEVEFLGYCPSAVAAAAISCAAGEPPAPLSFCSRESAALWRTTGLTEDHVVSCYRLMQELVLDGGGGGGAEKRRSPQIPVPPGKCASDSAASGFFSSLPSPSPSSSSSSSSTPPSSSSSGKRRKLSSCRWVLDGIEARRPTEEDDDVD